MFGKRENPPTGGGADISGVFFSFFSSSFALRLIFWSVVLFPLPSLVSSSGPLPNQGTVQRDHKLRRAAVDLLPMHDNQHSGVE